METHTDINPFDLFSGNSSKRDAKEAEISKVNVDPKQLYYDITGEKILIVFNHFKYDAESTAYYKDPPEPRTVGNIPDVGELEATFKQLGFKVDIHNNKDHVTILDLLGKFLNGDMSVISCVCVVFLTHGAKGGQLAAYDCFFDFKDVLNMFENNAGLAGKPKLFFLQACRGKKTDAGLKIKVATDGPSQKQITYTIPSHADFLVMRSTVEDYLSYRDFNGSWMIQELCIALKKYHGEDILHILTYVHQAVALGYSTHRKDLATHNKRLMPETTYTLTKLLKF